MCITMKLCDCYVGVHRHVRNHECYVIVVMNVYVCEFCCHLCVAMYIPMFFECMAENHCCLHVHMQCRVQSKVCMDSVYHDGG